MNTFHKGDVFEQICFRIIENALEKRDLGLIKKDCKLFRKKGYYSEKREKEIIFDLSIEVWPKNAKNYTLLYLIECKNYDGNVPVNDIEEFESKIRQVTGLNCKGIFITNSDLQEGALTAARKFGLMLIQTTSEITYNIIFHKANRHRTHSYQKEVVITKQIQAEFEIKKTGLLIEKTLLAAFIEYVKETDNTNRLKPQHLNIAKIEEFSEQLINCFDPIGARHFWKLSLDKLLSYMHNVYGLEMEIIDNTEFDSNHRRILGSCSFKERKIYIQKELVNTKRFLFFVCHEIGHFLLHNKIAISQNAYEGFSDSEYSYVEDKHLLRTDRDFIEWQANRFSASLIMPKLAFISKLTYLKCELGIPPLKQLFLDSQRSNTTDFYFIIKNLSNHFNTSKTSVIYRLKELHQIRIENENKSLGKLLHEHFKHLIS